MKLWTKITNSGISLQLSNQAPDRLEPSKDVDQRHPRRCYIYAHYDEMGTPFYIGKGSDRRAWKDKRHPLWHRYVKTRILIVPLTSAGRSWFLMILLTALYTTVTKYVSISISRTSLVFQRFLRNQGSLELLLKPIKSN